MYVSKASIGVQLLSHCRHQWSPTPTSIPGAWGTRNPGPVRGSERALASQSQRARVGPPCPVGFGDAGGSLGPNKSSISGPALKNNRFGTVGEGSGRRRAARIVIAFNIERQSNTFRPSTLPTPDAIEFVLVSPPPGGSGEGSDCHFPKGICNFGTLFSFGPHLLIVSEVSGPKAGSQRFLLTLSARVWFGNRF